MITHVAVHIEPYRNHNIFLTQVKVFLFNIPYIAFNNRVESSGSRNDKVA